MPFVKVPGVDVHYVVHGSAEADRTAVFLHGFPLDSRSTIAEFEPAFAGRTGCRRLYLDFPGMGRTKAPDRLASTDEVFHVTRAAIDALVPGDYILGGSSYGGYIAAGLAAEAPDRVGGLALIVPMVLPHGQRVLGVHQVLLRENGVAGPELFEQTAVIITSRTLSRTREEVEDAMAIADQDAVARIEARYGGSFPIGGRYEHPALVVVGRQDSVLGFNDQWQLFGQWPRATFAVLDRGGHGLSIELEPLHKMLVSDWLDRVEAHDSR